MKDKPLKGIRKILEGIRWFMEALVMHEVGRTVYSMEQDKRRTKMEQRKNDR